MVIRVHRFPRDHGRHSESATLVCQTVRPESPMISPVRVLHREEAL